MTCRKRMGDTTLYNAPPQSTLEQQIELFSKKGHDVFPLIVGELERLPLYAQKGFIEECEVPREVWEAGEAVNRTQNTVNRRRKVSVPRTTSDEWRTTNHE